MAARKKATKGRSTKKPVTAKSVKKKSGSRARPSPKLAAKKPAAKKPAAKKPAAKKPAAKKRAARTLASKKPAAKKPAAKKPKSNGAVVRRDATGHLNPKYAADLRARTRESAEDLGSTNAFLRRARAHDTLAEELGEDAVTTMTSGEDQSDRMQDMLVEEENGGPFVTTSGREEYARGTDKSNPKGATREPFPTTRRA